VTPDEVAADVVRVVEAGAGAVHVHVKDADGRDTFDADRLAAVLAQVRAVSSVPVGVTTGAWALPAVPDRLRAIAAWSALPDVASVNWHEDGAEAVAEALLDRGVAVEAGLWQERAASAWRRSPLRERCVRVLLELPDLLDEHQTLARARSMRAAAGPLDPDQELLLHGEGTSCWPAVALAARAGLATRIGLEDTLTLPDGAPVSGNAELVVAARATVADGDQLG
jgi:uncharacterized protein (DUF849 family)